MNAANRQPETQKTYRVVNASQKSKRFQWMCYFIFLIVLIMFIEVIYSGIFLSQQSASHHSIFVEQRTEEDGVITIMTLNMRHGKGMDGFVRLDEIAKLIEKSAADIVGLQEVDRYWLRSGRVDQVRWLGEELGMAWVYAPTIRYGRMQYGNAILSKFPLIWHEVIALPGKWEGRNVMRVLISVDGNPLLVHNTHLGVRLDERERQFPQLMQALSDPLPLSVASIWGENEEQWGVANVNYRHSKVMQDWILDSDDVTHEKYRLASNRVYERRDPRIAQVLMGDFNMEVTDEWFQYFDPDWIWAEVDEPTHIYGKQIDHVFVSPHIQILDASVVATEASDHAPVVVKLKFHMEMDENVVIHSTFH